MADKTKPKPVGEMSFEEALAELERIVSGLEAGTVPLEQSIAMYTRGAELQERCSELLKSAEARIEKIAASGGKATGTTPLDVE